MKTKIIELAPINIPTLEWEQIEDEIKKIFRKSIYIPLLKEIYQKASVLKNSKEDLIDALQKGRLTFSQGRFSGELNASLSKELRKLGAKWDRREKVYRILQKDLPYDLRSAISVSEARFSEKLAQIDKKIASILPEQLIEHLKIDRFFDKSLFKVNKSFEASVKKITVAPQLSEESAEALRKEWQDNIKLSIKGIASEVLPKLRKEIQASAYQGNRYESLLEILQKSYGLSASRAKYVARNETNLMMAKFKEKRLAEVGVREYRWQCVKGTPDHEVRPIHRELTERSKKGEVFRFDQPPIAEANGERYNPHERNNCFPGSTLVGFNQRILKIFRRRYTGKLTLLIAPNDVVHESTPNHPILTNRGWIAAQNVELGDYIFQGNLKNVGRTKMDAENMVSTFEQIFDALRVTCEISRRLVSTSDFHGDVTENNHVDIININRDLILDGVEKLYEVIEKFQLESANREISVLGSFQKTLTTWGLSAQSLIRFENELLFFLKRHSSHSKNIRLRTGTFDDICFFEPSRDRSSTESIFFGNGELTHPFLVILDRLLIDRQSIPSTESGDSFDFDATPAESLAEQMSVDAEFTTKIRKRAFRRFVNPLRVIDKTFRDFSSHVYNFETSTNWYYARNLIVSNCRCTAVPIIRFK